MASIHKEICEVCVKSDVLCPVCQEKYDKGIIEDIDLKVARFLKGLEEKFKVLKDAQIVKVFKTDSKIIIITRKGDAHKIVGKNGSIAKLVSKEFGKPVKVIEEGEDVKEFIENLVYPAKIESVNIVYGREGEVAKYKVLVDRKQSRKIDRELLKDAFEKIYKKPIEIIIL